MAGLEGTRLGDYELVEQIGSGGMAEVYRARQLTAFSREVAVKVIRPGFSEKEEFRARFLREAQSISRLSHPNILPLIEFGEEDQALYLVMPLVREGTLRDLIRQRNRPLPLEEARPLFTQLCGAVHYAHSQGIIHRDIKPQNVLLQQHTHVLLADFGIARDRSEKTITATGAGVGSAEYMAPEQAMGQADTRSDIYSLGIVLYQMLTGSVPYSGSTPLQVLMKHTTAPLPDPRTLNPSLSPRIVEALQTALAKDRDERFQSAQALARAVQEAQAEAASSPASSAPAWQPSNQFIQPPAGASFPPPASSHYADLATPYEQSSAAPTPASSPGSYDTRPASNYGPPPGSMAPSSQPIVSPALPIKPPPRKKKTGLIALISALALVVLLGGMLLALGLTGNGPFGSLGANLQTTPTPTTGPIPTGFKLYTHTDHSFSIIYPTASGWSMKAAITVNGSGEEFDGPASQVVQVVNGGSAQSSDTGSNDDAFCVVFGATTNGHTTVTLAGQQWTREECDSFGGIAHAIVETIVYKGQLYLLSYASTTGSFDSNRRQYFTQMEQSFTFLT
ncbi:MAG TPA: serine/threonine-protein kinase [Ktedonobacterales bacterium]|jgi:serine/threonine protein kinase